MTPNKIYADVVSLGSGSIHLPEYLSPSGMSVIFIPVDLHFEYPLAPLGAAAKGFGT